MPLNFWLMRKLVLNAVFLANLLAILGFWWLGSGNLVTSGNLASTLIGLGRVMGLLLEFAILVQLVLISRIPYVERTYGFDRLNQFHRILGYCLLGTLLAHPLLLTLGFALSNQVSFWDTFTNLLFHWPYVMLAVIGLSVIVLAAIISLPSIRKKLKYETWHLTHLFMYVGIGLIFAHQVQTADVSVGRALYYWYILNFTVFGCVLFYRFLQPFLLFFRHRFRVSRVEGETHNVQSVHITGEHMDRFKFESGQYIHVSFLAKGLWQPHPFSISSAPNGQDIRLSIKAVGDFTERIKELQPGTRVILEGPFGKFTEQVAAHPKFLLIAGGIGITPIRALCETLSQRGKDIILLYSNRTPEDMVFKQELAQLNIPTHHVLSETSEEGFEHGRIDLEKITRLVPDVKERDIYLCGPPPMMKSLVAILKSLGAKNSQIHYEKFSY